MFVNKSVQWIARKLQHFLEFVSERMLNYYRLLSLENEIKEFSLAKPSWYMNHHTMLYKYGKRTRGKIW